MNEPSKEAIVNTLLLRAHEHFRHHLTDFVNAYNFSENLRLSKGSHLTNMSVPSDKEPQRFKLNPTHIASGPYMPTKLAIL